MRAFKLMVAGLLLVLATESTGVAQTSFSECGTVVSHFGLCNLLELANGDRYWLDNFGTAVVGDMIQVDGMLDTGCFNTCTAVPCVFGVVISSCAPPPVPFSECGTIVSHFGLCNLFETANGDQYFLDNYGTAVVGDMVQVDGILDAGCFNTCSAVPCVNNVVISACPPPPVPFSECGTIVSHFGLCNLFETANGDRYFLDNYGTAVVGDMVQVDGILDAGCFNTCTAVPCVNNVVISACPPPPVPFSECGTIVSHFGLCNLFETANGDQYFLDNYGTAVVGDMVQVDGILDAGCFNTCSAVPCVNSVVISACPIPFSECGTIVSHFGLCMVFEAPNGDRYNLDNFGSFIVGDAVLVEGTLDRACFSTCAAEPCVTGNTIVSCAPPAPEFQRGDCNDDGLTNIADAITGLNNLFGVPTPVTCQDACDANDDGLINIADPVSVLAALFQSQPLPGPFMTCGVDATPSMLTCDSSTACP